MPNILQIITAVNHIIPGSYLVGGAVRDYLLKQEVKDYDFATALTPDEVESKLRIAGRRPFLIGKKFLFKKKIVLQILRTLNS